MLTVDSIAVDEHIYSHALKVPVTLAYASADSDQILSKEYLIFGFIQVTFLFQKFQKTHKSNKPAILSLTNFSNFFLGIPLH